MNSLSYLPILLLFYSSEDSDFEILDNLLNHTTFKWWRLEASPSSRGHFVISRVLSVSVWGSWTSHFNALNLDFLVSGDNIISLDLKICHLN